MTLHQISYGQQKQTKRCFSLQPKKDCRLKQHYSTELPVIGLVITGASLTKNWWNIMNFGTPGRCTSVEKMRKKNNLHNAPGTPNSWRLDMSSSTAISEFHSTFSLSFYSNKVFSSSSEKNNLSNPSPFHVYKLHVGHQPYEQVCCYFFIARHTSAVH